MAAEVRCLIYARTGALLAEVVPQVETVSWRLNRVGVARFALPWTETRATPAALRFGNRVILKFGNGLPDWGGVIDPPRTRVHGAVVVTAYTGDRLLAWRRTGPNRLYRNASPGSIFRALIEEENTERPTGIVVGSIDTGGDARWESYHYRDLLAAVQGLADASGHDYEVKTLGGALFQGNWYQRRGSDRSGSAALKEGANVDDAVLDEQGPVVNMAIAAGQGTAWSKRLEETASDATSIGLYGYRERAEVYGWATLGGALAANADAMLARYKYPVLRGTVITTNRAPGTFGSYDVGDIVAAELHSQSTVWQFDGDVRVIAREWLPDDRCRVEVEEWHG